MTLVTYLPPNVCMDTYRNNFYVHVTIMDRRIISAKLLAYEPR